VSAEPWQQRFVSSIAEGLLAGLEGDDRELLAVGDWGRRYLVHHHTAAPSEMHQALDEDLSDLHKTRNHKVVYAAPRGAAKTTWIQTYVLRAICEGLERYILWEADTGSQAKAYLAVVKAELEGNDAIHRDYPHVAGEGAVWREDRILTRNGVLVEALGTGQAVRGRRHKQWRPTLVIVDDPENDEQVMSAARRDKSWDWFTKALLKVGRRHHTNFVVAGTHIHRDCMVARLAKTQGWRSRVFQAVVRWPERMDLWAEWERLYLDVNKPDAEETARAFYDQHKEAMDKGSRLLWPAMDTLYDLMVERASGGHAAFESERQNNPIDPSTCEWPPEYTSGEDLWFERWPERRTLTVCTIAVDPSKGRDARRGDYSAIVILGRTRDGALLVEGDLERRPTDAIVARTIELGVSHQPDALVVETNAFQELLQQDMEQEAAAQGAILPFAGVDNRVKKEVRIRRLTTYLARRQLRFRDTAGTRLLVEQLRDFPHAAHDDGPDALEMALRAAIQVFNGRAAGVGDRLPGRLMG